MKRLLSYSMFVLVAMCLALGVTSVRAQLVPRTVLLEEGTNDGCGPCAQMNPGVESFLKQHEGSVIHLSYHPNWPNPSDPMYLNDKADATGRVQTYYGISGVPSVSVSGCATYVPSSPTLIENSFDSCIALGSPVAIAVTRVVNGTTVEIHIAIHPVQDLSAYKTLKLRVAAVEDFVPGPGPNGEARYVHVMRTMMPNHLGTTVKIAQQDTAFDFSYDLNDSYNDANMYEVAFLQNDATKEVLQAASDQPGFQLVPNPGTQIVQRVSGGAATLPFTLSNTMPQSLAFTLRYTPTSHNQWPVTVNGQDASAGQAINLGSNQSSAISVAATRGVGSYSTGVISVTSTASGETLVASYPLKFISPDASVAFIDVSADSARSANTLATLDALSLPYVPLTSTEAVAMNGWSASAFPEMVLVANKWIITGGDKARVSQYLKSGGHLLASGGEIAFGLVDPLSSAADRDVNFLKYTLHATYVRDSAGPRTVHGVANDSVTGAFASSNLNIYALKVDEVSGSSPSYNQPDEIKAANNAIQIFYYGSGTAQCAGVRWDSAQTKLVYLAFGIQNLADADRSSIVTAAMTWFHENSTQSGVANAPPVASLLGPNYPNPFSRSTIIPYSLTRSEAVRISIVDARGAEVVTLVDEFKSIGDHVASFDASRLARGTYFCVIHTSEGSAMRPLTIE